MEKKRPTLQYLLIDLAREQWKVLSLGEEPSRKLLGGSGVAIELYSRHQEVSEGPIASPIVFSNGLLGGLNTANPSQLTIASVSPLSRAVRLSGGMSRFPSLLSSCGFHSIVLVGSARRQMLIRIDEQGVTFTASEHLIGKRISESIRTLNLTKDQSALLIGPAGEREVPYASIMSDLTAIDREGFGAVLGMKRIKGIIVSGGSYSYTAGSREQTLKDLADLDSAINSSYLARLSHDEGQLYPVRVAMEKGAASVRHGSGRFDPRMKHLCFSEHPQLYSIDEKGRILYQGEGMLIPVTALMMLAFGSNIGNYDPQLAMRFVSTSLEAGLDPVSTARVVSWCMEASHRGVCTDFGVTYRDVSSVEDLIDQIAKSPSGSVLLKGTAGLAEQYQATQFITGINGKETLPVDPRGAYGQALVMALGYDYLLPGELLTPQANMRKVQGKGKEVLESELLYLLSTAFGLSYDQMFSLKVKKGRTLRTKGSGLEILQTLLSRLYGVNYDAEDLMRVALRILLNYEKVSGRFADSVHVPLQWLIDGSSNLNDESTVPFTKIYEEYLHERELLVVEYAAAD